MDELLLVKQGKYLDSVVYDLGKKKKSCYVWHYDESKNIVYHAYYPSMLEPPIYQKYATYDENGNLTGWQLINSEHKVVERREYKYNEQGNVISFADYAGLDPKPQHSCSINYSNKRIYLTNELPKESIGKWTWEYNFQEDSRTQSVKVTDTVGNILLDWVYKPNKALCKDSTIKKSTTIINNDNAAYYKTEQVLLDQYQPSIQVPITNGNLDKTNAEIQWDLKKENVLLEVRQFDKRDSLVLRTKYYYDEFTIILKSYDMKPERLVSRTDEIFDSKGNLNLYITYFNGGNSKQYFYYNTLDALERIDYYVNKKLHHQVYYYSF
jgi:hypothetical protein